MDQYAVTWKGVPFIQTESGLLANPVTAWFNLIEAKMYDMTNHALASTPVWTDCVDSLTVVANSGVYVDIPDALMPTGWYLWRLWDSAAPEVTTLASIGRIVYWDQSKRLITQVMNP